MAAIKRAVASSTSKVVQLVEMLLCMHSATDELNARTGLRAKECCGAYAATVDSGQSTASCAFVCECMFVICDKDAKAPECAFQMLLLELRLRWGVATPSCINIHSCSLV